MATDVVSPHRLGGVGSGYGLILRWFPRTSGRPLPGRSSPISAGRWRSADRLVQCARWAGESPAGPNHAARGPPTDAVLRKWLRRRRLVLSNIRTGLPSTIRCAGSRPRRRWLFLRPAVA